MQLVPSNRLRDYILQLDQVRLFAAITGIPEVEIEECISVKNRVTLNLMRDERNASTTFYIKNGKVLTYDYADSTYRGDIFDITGVQYKLNCNNPRDFIKICNILINIAFDQDIPKITIAYKDKSYVPTEIDYEVRNYDKYIDGSYWNKYGIGETALLRERIYPVLTATILKKGVTSHYFFSKKDRCYTIILYPLFYSKLYFVDRTKASKLPRFITNFPHPIERPDLLVKGDVLILIKATKCRAVLNNILVLLSRDFPQLSNYTIVVNSLSSESVTFSKHWDTLLGRYDIVKIILDNDAIGMFNADRLILQGFDAEAISTGYKDLSDTWVIDKFLAIDYIYNLLCDLNIL